MNVRETLKRKVIWWVIGSLGLSGFAILFLILIMVVTLLGMMVASSDPATSGFQSGQVESLEIPMPLLSIYLQAQNEKVSWALLAAIHQVTTDFGQRKSTNPLTIGFVGFPSALWQDNQQDGDENGEMDPDNPYDAIFSLSHYMNQQNGTLDQALETFLLVPEQIAQVKEIETKNLSSLRLQNGWLWPLIGYTDLSSTYGTRNDPFSEQQAFHDGIDIPAPIGTPVLAIRDGTVVFASEDPGGYGNLIRIEHVNKLQSFYGHLSVIGVKSGQIVHQGEMIGLVGTTGKSTGPHLHLGMSQNGKSINPLDQWTSHF